MYLDLYVLCKCLDTWHTRGQFGWLDSPSAVWIPGVRLMLNHRSKASLRNSGYLGTYLMTTITLVGRKGEAMCYPDYSETHSIYRQAFNSKRSACLCLPTAGIKVEFLHHPQLPGDWITIQTLWDILQSDPFHFIMNKHNLRWVEILSELVLMKIIRLQIATVAHNKGKKSHPRKEKESCRFP